MHHTEAVQLKDQMNWPRRSYGPQSIAESGELQYANDGEIKAQLGYRFTSVENRKRQQGTDDDIHRHHQNEQMAST